MRMHAFFSSYLTIISPALRDQLSSLPDRYRQIESTGALFHPVLKALMISIQKKLRFMD